MAGPGRRRVDFQQRIFRREQLSDNLFALDDEEPRVLAVLFLAQGAETGEVGLGQRHGAT